MLTTALSVQSVLRKEKTDEFPALETIGKSILVPLLFQMGSITHLLLKNACYLETATLSIFLIPGK